LIAHHISSEFIIRPVSRAVSESEVVAIFEARRATGVRVLVEFHGGERIAEV
jgi:hypothetical protein